MLWMPWAVAPFAPPLYTPLVRTVFITVLERGAA